MEPTMMNCMFPVEIMMSILSHLPIKSLVRFRCVCKSWFRLFTGQHSDPYFTQLFDEQSTLANPNPILIHLDKPCNFRFASDYTEIDNPSMELKEPDWYTDELGWYWGDNGVCVRIYGICNGLVCLESASGKSDVMYIWNPMTRDNITIPCPPYLFDKSIKRNKRAVYGFGHCQVSNEYKVIAVFVSSLGRDVDKYDYQCHSNVLTLGTNTWKPTQDVLFDVKIDHFSCGRLVNGALHWIIQEQELPFQEKIISFDLKCERFQEIKMPISNHFLDVLHVEELSGMLAILWMDKDNTEDVQIWVMKDYGVQESWTKQCAITKSQLRVQYFNLELFGLANDGNIMMRNQDVLVLLNPKTNSIRTRKFFALGDSLLSTYFYKWSLVSPRYITVLKPITATDESEQQKKASTLT